MGVSGECKPIWMPVSYAAISQGSGNLLPSAPLRPGRRFNFVGVLADYRHLSGAVTENAAPAGSEQGAGALIRTAALGRFPRGGRLDRAGAADADALDVRWKQQDGPRRWTPADLQVSHHLIGSLQAGTPSAFVGGTRKLKGCILIGFVVTQARKGGKFDKTDPTPLDLLKK